MKPISSLVSLPLLLLIAACQNRYADFTLPRTTPANRAWLRLSQRAQPVLPRDSASDVLNPSVVFFNDRYWNFYSQFDGRTWTTAVADSPDGIIWHKRAQILAPDPSTWEGGYIAANGSSANLDGGWFYWFVAGPESRPSIGLAVGQNPAQMHKRAQPVLSPGPRGSFDELAVADPYVIRIENSWYMYYLGMDRARRQQIGLARSPNGFVWQKLRSNPVVHISEPGGMDDRGLGEPAVWQSNGWYWMLFTGRDAGEIRTLGLARSTDGVHWLRSSQVFRGAESWNNKVLCDPSVLVENGKIRVWFGGGDVASPDQNLHGQIGYGEME